MSDARIETEREIAFERVLSSIGHALGTPLQVISGRASMIAADSSDPGAAEHARIIVRKVGELSQMVRDLLQLARGEAAAEDRIDIAPLVDAVVKSVQQFATAEGVSVRGAALEGAFIKGRADLFSVGLDALLRELIRQCDSGAELSVAVRNSNHEVTCAVSGLTRHLEANWIDAAHNLVHADGTEAEMSSVLRRAVGFGVVRRLGGRCGAKTLDGQEVLEIVFPSE